MLQTGRTHVAVAVVEAVLTASAAARSLIDAIGSLCKAVCQATYDFKSVSNELIASGIRQLPDRSAAFENGRLLHVMANMAGRHSRPKRTR